MGLTMKAGPLTMARLDLESEPQDFDALASIQSELAIAFQLLEAGIRESDTGFLISAYKPEDFRGFLQRGGSILGARQGEGGPLIGYLLGNSGETFLANHPTTKLLWDNPQAESQYNHIYSSGSFTYLDQIGVARAFHGMGVAQELHRRFLSLVRKPVVAAIVQAPLRNARSTVFFKKLGYHQVGMFHTAELKGLRDVRSAVLALPADVSSL